VTQHRNPKIPKQEEYKFSIRREKKDETSKRKNPVADRNNASTDQPGDLVSFPSRGE
jgi:hypothetical protein